MQGPLLRETEETLGSLSLVCYLNPGSPEREAEVDRDVSTWFSFLCSAEFAVRAPGSVRGCVYIK